MSAFTSNQDKNRGGGVSCGLMCLLDMKMWLSKIFMYVIMEG